MYTKPFKELSRSDVAAAGGKGATLGEMIQNGIPVPDGFVVLSNSFEQFMHETGIRADIQSVFGKVRHQDTNSIEQASVKIRAIIMGQEMPADIKSEIKKQSKKLGAQYVAVRSSATSEDGSEAAWAGQLESYLNTTEKNLLENVKKCWGSLFTPRAIFYRFEKNLQNEFISVAVVVQKMIQSEISGIGFSVHPVTENRNQLIIEAGYGLGEAIVSGAVTPDSYVVLKKEHKILEKNISEQSHKLIKAVKDNEWVEVPRLDQGKQKLSDADVLKLAALIKKIEAHYGFPVDTEWAKENKKFYLTQSRPITTLSTSAALVSKKNAGTELSKIYSREKTLFYFCMWNDSDRLGYKKFLGYEVQNNLFLVPPPGQKGSVWYAKDERDAIEALLVQKITDSQIVSDLRCDLDAHWKILLPYLTGKKKIEDVKGFAYYYNHLVGWWAAMNTAFDIPDMKSAPPKTRKTFLSYRSESEKYTEKMNKIFIEFWKDYYPKYVDVVSVITPGEVQELARGPFTSKQHAKLRKRLLGIGMLNGTVYAQSELEKVLKKKNLSLETLTVETAAVIKGTAAFPGKVKGIVKIVRSFKDMVKIAKGDVLVTEMTNPDYVSVMKIASAIVTDEGGATCHAAIASREMKIPCIVGTKISTQMLHDGDMVEVDATAGIVRIIKSKK